LTDVATAATLGPIEEHVFLLSSVHSQKHFDGPLDPKVMPDFAQNFIHDDFCAPQLQAFSSQTQAHVVSSHLSPALHFWGDVGQTQWQPSDKSFSFLQTLFDL
jgi:hypothetical protein